jgi:hypothetical protein
MNKGARVREVDHILLTSGRRRSNESKRSFAFRLHLGCLHRGECRIGFGETAIQHWLKPDPAALAAQKKAVEDQKKKPTH